MSKYGGKKSFLAGVLFALVAAGVLTRCTPHGTTVPPAPLAEIPGLTTRFEKAASALIPQISTVSASDLSKLGSGAAALTYQTEEEWNEILRDLDSQLENIFGPREGSNDRIETKLRVLIHVFAAETIAFILENDPGVTCEGAEVLNEGDSLQIPFYGEISNGSAEDRWFECLYESYVYGLTSDGTLRIVRIGEFVWGTLRFKEERGEEGTYKEVVHVIYNEELEGEGITASLDLQVATWINYEGPDLDVTQTTDNVSFRTRSRITGRVAFDATDTVKDAVGDFSATSSEKYPESSATPHTITDADGSTQLVVREPHSLLQTAGRGSYASGGTLLFNIDYNLPSFDGNEGIYCLTVPSSGNPQYTDPSNCAGLETRFAWGDFAFPFGLTPAIEEAFEKVPLYAEDELISDSADNFVVPEYETF